MIDKDCKKRGRKGACENCVNICDLNPHMEFYKKVSAQWLSHPESTFDEAIKAVKEEEGMQ